MGKKKTEKCPNCRKNMDSYLGPVIGTIVYECKKCRVKVIRRE